MTKTKIIDGLLYEERRPGVYQCVDEKGFGERVANTAEIMKARRKELKMTQQQLADAIGTNKSTISRYESGYIDKMPTGVIIPIARALRCSETYLIGSGDDPNREWYEDDPEIVASRYEDVLLAYSRAPETIQKAIRVLLGLDK